MCVWPSYPKIFYFNLQVVALSFQKDRDVNYLKSMMAISYGGSTLLVVIYITEIILESNIMSLGSHFPMHQAVQQSLVKITLCDVCMIYNLEYSNILI